jgi:hypothetical protein
MDGDEDEDEDEEEGGDSPLDRSSARSCGLSIFVYFFVSENAAGTTIRNTPIAGAFG